MSDRPIKVAIFDDVLAARREVFHIPGLEIGVYGHADDVQVICHGDSAPDVLCMDYAMGSAHVNGDDAIRAVRVMGFQGKIVAMSSDPAANQRMIDAGANESIMQKAMLRSYLVALGAGRLGGGEHGGAALALLVGMTALCVMAAGAWLLGPGSWQSRYQDGNVRLDARVLPQGAPRSPVDDAPSPVEAVTVWVATAERFEQVAGTAEIAATASFVVAARGRRILVETDVQTAWLISQGPSRRLHAPSEVPQGAQLAASPGARYLARSRRVTEGAELTVVGRLDGDRVLASLVVDERFRAVLGHDLVGKPLPQVGGFGLLLLGAALLGGAGRAA